MNRRKLQPLALAYRNLRRNTRRSLTTLFAMIFGALAILVFGGYSRSIQLGLETNIVRAAGHLQIQHADYFLFGAGNPQLYGIARYAEIIRKVSADPEIAPALRVISPVIAFGGVAGNSAAGVSKIVSAVGAIPEDQIRMRDWNEHDMPLVARRPALAGTPPDSAVIGYGVARILELCRPLQIENCPRPHTIAEPGGESMPADLGALVDNEKSGRPAASPRQIEVLAARANGTPNVVSLTVVKVERQGIKSVDDIFLGMHLQTAQALLYRGESPRVTAITIQLAHTEDIPMVARRIQLLLDAGSPDQPLTVLDFRALNPNFSQTAALFDAIFGFISVLIATIVLFTVGNTMNMAVVERTGEIGTLRAMGLRRSGVHRMFLMEGALIGAAGAACGTALSILVAWLLNHSGLSWTPPGYTDPVPLAINIWGDSGLIVGTFLGLTLVAAISALVPARQAARYEIVDALRHA